MFYVVFFFVAWWEEAHTHTPHSPSPSFSLTTITNLPTFYHYFFIPSLDRYVGSPRLENVLVATFQRSSVLHSVVPNQGWETTAVPSGESGAGAGAGVGVSSVGHHFYQSGGVSAMNMRGGGAGGIDRCPDPYRLHYRVDMVSLRVRMVRNVSFRKVIDGHYDRAAAKRRRRRRRRLAEEQKRRESTLLVGGGGGNRGKKHKIDTVSFLQRKAASDGSGGSGGNGRNGGGRGTSVSVDGDIEMIDVLTPLGESKSTDGRAAAAAKSKEIEQQGGQQRQIFLDKSLQNEQKDVQGQQQQQQQQQQQEGGTVFSPSSSTTNEGKERHDVRSGGLDQGGRGGQKAVTTPSLTKETRSEKKEFERATRSGSNVGRSSHKVPKDRSRRRRRKRGETFVGGNGGGGKRSSRKGRQSSSDSPRRPGGKKRAVSIRFNPDPEGSSGGGGSGLIDLGAAAVGGVKRGVTRGVTSIFRRMNENYHGKVLSFVCLF